MNILFLTGTLPFPLDNGQKIRTFNLIRKLSEGNNITLLISEEKDADIDRVNKIKEFCKNVRIVPYQELSGIQLLFRLFLSLFGKQPFTLLKRFSKNMQREIDFLLDNKHVDIVICNRLTETLYFLNKHNKIKKVYSTHNIEYLLVRRFFKITANPFKKIASYIEWKKTANYERKVWKNFDFSIAVSKNDKKIIAEFVPDERVFVIPNGTDTGYFRSKANVREPLSIIYTGQMGWYPNEDSVIYFVDKIYPLIKKEIPNIKFFIVGGNASKRIQALSRRNNNNNAIEVTGRVKDIRKYIDKASVYIVPLRIGSGTRIKILDALAMKKPVVSTSIGCEGLDVTNGENIVIADNPAEFANKVISLLRDEETCQRLGNAGRRLIKEKYDWQIIYQELDKLNNRLEVIVKKEK